MAGLSVTILALVAVAAAGVLAPLTIGRVADAGHRPVRPIALRPVVAAPTVALRSAEHPAAPSAVHGSAARTALASAVAPHGRGGRSTASPAASPIAFRPGVTASPSTAAPTATTAPVALPVASTLAPAADKATDDDAGVSTPKPHTPKPGKSSGKKPKTARSSRPHKTQPLLGKSGK